ncbi:arginase family protein [Pseudomonas kitaguniensis]|uniref:arginase family protein n=1 Tax=Pseudomonas kitaguniensis TaxID=2607908 RepID=UPI003D067D82
MNTSNAKTLRLLFPQWQGGNNPPYHFGSQLLSWLAPEAHGPVAEVPVTAPVTAPSDEPLPIENGIRGRSALLRQLRSARAIIDEHAPDRLVVLGGDCLVDLAPFAYLNERYAGDLAVLWVDAHPDVLTPRDFPNAHAMVLGHLLGEGDADFADTVKLALKPANVMYAGLMETSPVENTVIERLGLQHASPAQLADSSEPVLQWLRSTGAKHLAIHLDLDVLDPNGFRSVLFADPQAAAGAFDGVAQGNMTISHVVRLLSDVATVTDVVGIGIAEHLPWDALALKNMLARLPLIGSAV